MTTRGQSAVPQDLSWTAAALAAAYRNKALTPVEVADDVARRVAAAESLGAYISFDPVRARTEAEASARRFDRGEPLGPLDGVPIGFKDNIDVAGAVTTGGTPGLRRHRPPESAPLAGRLFAAGAIFAGKLNLHELAGGGTTDNPTFGRVANTYRRQAIPGGSSGGSAVAVVARIIPIALGSDTAGSIRNPAHYCGAVGFKPSLKRYPAAGVVPLSYGLDCVGPIAHTVADVIACDAVMAADPTPVTPAELKGLRLGVPKTPFQDNLHRDVRRQFDFALDVLDRAGVALIEAEIDGLSDDVAALGLITLGGSFRDDLTQYLSQSRAEVSADDVFGQIADPFVRGWAEPFYRPSDEVKAQFSAALPRWRRMKAAYAEYLVAHRLAAIVFPTAPIPAGDPVADPNDVVIDGETIKGGVWLNVRNAQPGSLWGAPGLSLPMGQTASGLPLGLELDAAVGADKTLLSIAQSVEMLMPRLPPPPA